MENGPKMGPWLLRADPLFGDLFRASILEGTFSSHLAPFWFHFCPFGLPFGTFGLPFAPFWLPFHLFWLTFGSLLLFLGSFFFSLALFWCLFESFYSFSRFLHRFLLIPRDFARIYNDFLSITAQPLQVIVWTLAFACAQFSEARCGDIAVGNWDRVRFAIGRQLCRFLRFWADFLAIEKRIKKRHP